MIKKTLFFASLALMVSCQDSIYEFEMDCQTEKQTRSVELSTEDYYWFGEEKIPIREVPNKSFVLFDEKYEEQVKSSLPVSKTADGLCIYDFNYSGTDMSGDSAEKFQHCKWAEVDMDSEFAGKFTFVKYAAPFYFGINDEPMPLTNLICVTLKGDGDLDVLKDLAKSVHAGIIGKYVDLPNLYILSCDKDSGLNAMQAANVIHESGKVEWAQPNFISLTLDSNDTYFGNQWNLVSSNGYDINYSNALNYIPSTSDITVGIVDTGIQLNHPDLNLSSYSLNISGSSNSSPSIIRNNNAHGTNVAGIISAKTGNSMGIAGIAPCVKSISISAAIDPSQMLIATEVASGIIHAVSYGASVINCSWHIAHYDSSISDAIRTALEQGRDGKGCVLVAASGNSGTSSLSYPASHSTDEEMIAVGAIDSYGRRYSGSNYGSRLDLVAPGVNIPTTTLNSSWTQSFTGTSAAAPHVSAAAALILSINPNLTYKEVGLILNLSAKKNLPNVSFSNSSWGGTWNSQVGHGLLDLQAALNYASSTLNPTSTYSPVVMSGPYSITTDMSGNARTTISVTPNNPNYTYVWSSSFTGSYDRWFIFPSDNGYGSSCEVSAYLYTGQYGGTIQLNCKVYGPTGFVGQTFHLISVYPGSYPGSYY